MPKEISESKLKAKITALEEHVETMKTRADNCQRRLHEVDKERNELADKVKTLTIANDKLGKRIEQLTLRAVSIVIASLSEYSDFNGPRALDEVREILDA